VALHLRQSIGLGTLETDPEKDFEGMQGRTIGIGLLGLVVSADTSQTTESLRFGVSRDSMSMKLGILELR
jgi:hypothetical protein